ncbi:glutamate receptor ionotropic, kainate glr-3-like [Scylla paramamosain]|uniref:glutamate receptor ionotropic, kainate glr-3-like n=1 Tax=Scylla paramamosain TaxID=85552 RepID=UPI0030836E7F
MAPQADRCLKVGMVEYPMMTDVTGSPPYVNYSGPTVTILKLLMNHIDYCYRFVDSLTELYGQVLDNGSWTGLMGMLQRGEVDMTGSLFSVTWRRWQAVDFTPALYVDHTNMVYARPEVSSDMAGFIKPYTLLVWSALFLTTLLMFSATLFIYRGEAALKTLTKKGIKPQAWGWGTTAKKSSECTWSTLLAQSVPQMPDEGTTRFTVGLWLLVSLIIGTVYRSNLKAMLIIPKVELPFDSLEELIDTGFTVATISGTTMHLDIMTTRRSRRTSPLRQ